MDVTTEALQGFAAAPGAPCPFYASSPSWLAWTAGAWLRSSGRPAPRRVVTSRGARVRVGLDLLEVLGPGDVRQL